MQGTTFGCIDSGYTEKTGYEPFGILCVYKEETFKDQTKTGKKRQKVGEVFEKSHEIIVWTLSRTLETEAVVECMEMAKRRRNVQAPLVLHSDRGVQYTSNLYKEETEGITRSYSRKGNPWDNACIESFHALIKREWLEFRRFNNYEEVKASVFEYIEGFYNTIQIHSWCHYMSPNAYEKAYYMQNKKEVH